MKTPVYCIINDQAVKAVRTKEGTLEVLCYCPDSDEFKREMIYTEHIYFPTGTKALATDIVSKKEFEKYVAKLRKKPQ